MTTLKNTVLAVILFSVSTAANAVDMSKPTGIGALTITNISIGSKAPLLILKGLLKTTALYLPPTICRQLMVIAPAAL